MEKATRSADPNAALIARFLEATERKDMDAMSEFVHDDVVMEWPQSGERFRGTENARAAVLASGGGPDLAGEPRVMGSGDVWVVMMPLRYADGIHHYVGVFELEAGKIKRSTEYFGAPFPAPAERAPYRDRG